MKKKVWKFFAPIALIAVLIFSTIFASGCYIIKGVKMKDLVGTYEMTSYSAKTNVMEEREMKLYLVINRDGNGYYVFKDNDTELYASEMRVSFTANTEDSSKYDYVECTFNDGNTIKFGVAGKNLNYSKIVWKPLQWGEALQQDYTIRVSFKKVSKKTNLSYVEDKLKADLTALPYGLAQKAAVYRLENIMMDGWFLSREEVKTAGAEQPVYAYVRLDTFNDKATCYYMLASNEEQKEIEFTYTFVKQGVGEFHLTDNKGGVWILSNNQLRYMVPNAGEEGNQTMEWKFGWSASVDYDLTETIATNVGAYEANKCSYGKHQWTTPDVDQCEVQSTCSDCDATQGENIEHTYDDDNDAICNGCGEERDLPETAPEGSEEPIE